MALIILTWIISVYSTFDSSWTIETRFYRSPCIKRSPCDKFRRTEFHCTRLASPRFIKISRNVDAEEPTITRIHIRLSPVGSSVRRWFSSDRSSDCERNLVVEKNRSSAFKAFFLLFSIRFASILLAANVIQRRFDATHVQVRATDLLSRLQWPC